MANSFYCTSNLPPPRGRGRSSLENNFSSLPAEPRNRAHASQTRGTRSLFPPGKARCRAAKHGTGKSSVTPQPTGSRFAEEKRSHNPDFWNKGFPPRKAGWSHKHLRSLREFPPFQSLLCSRQTDREPRGLLRRGLSVPSAPCSENLLDLQPPRAAPEGAEQGVSPRRAWNGWVYPGSSSWGRGFGTQRLCSASLRDSLRPILFLPTQHHPQAFAFLFSILPQPNFGARPPPGGADLRKTAPKAGFKPNSREF